jgi:hypothetical protein
LTIWTTLPASAVFGCCGGAAGGCVAFGVAGSGAGCCVPDCCCDWDAELEALDDAELDDDEAEEEELELLEEVSEGSPDRAVADSPAVPEPVCLILLSAL